MSKEPLPRPQFLGDSVEDDPKGCTVYPVKPTLVKSHARNRIKLESTFAHLSHSWKTYKADLDLLETAFSAVDHSEGRKAYNPVSSAR